MRSVVGVIFAAGIVVAANAPPSVAQAERRSDDRWQLTVDSAQYIWDVRLVKLAGDTLIVRQADSLLPVRVGRISEIRLIKKTTVEVGAEGRDVIGALTGANDEVYDLSPLDFAERLRVIQKLLMYHPPTGD